MELVYCFQSQVQVDFDLLRTYIPVGESPTIKNPTVASNPPQAWDLDILASRCRSNAC
jgi:hypothetical protein